MMEGKVSIIIPTYNHAQFLVEAASSVMAQTYCDWEAIIIDDGSTDNTVEVADSFHDPRICYIYQKNRGLSTARNTGLRRATGEFVALLDADDVWEPTFLERMVSTLSTHATAGAGYCGFRYVDVEGSLLKQAICKVVSPDEFRNELMLNGNWLCPCSVVVRRSAYDAVGPFDESLRACEDFDMWLRMSQDHLFVGVPEILVRYRRSGNNMSDDPDRMSQARRSVLGRYLGNLNTPPETWSESKRRKARQIYSSEAQGFLARGRLTDSARSFAWLCRYQRDFAVSLSIWYSLACVHQNVGQRGDFDSWQPARAENDLMGLIEELRKLQVHEQLLRMLLSQAYHALAWLNYGRHDILATRHYLFRSYFLRPSLPDNRERTKLLLRSMYGVTSLRDLVRKILGTPSTVVDLKQTLLL